VRLRIEIFGASSGPRGNFVCDEDFMVVETGLPFQCVIGHPLARRAGMCFPRFQLSPPSYDIFYDLAKKGDDQIRNARKLLEVDRPLPSTSMRSLWDDCMALLIECHRESPGQVRITLDWDVPAFVDAEFGKGQFQSIREIVTLTGRLPDVWAASCQQYLSWKWPWISDCVVELVDVVLRSYWSQTEYSFQPKLEPHFTFHVEKGRDLTITSPQEVISFVPPQLADILEALAWVSATLRGSATQQVVHSQALYTRSPKAGTSQVASLILHLEDRSSLSEELGIDESCIGMCWRPLFLGTSVAFDFPIPARLMRFKGLEICYELMELICGVEYKALEEDGLVLRGHLTSLYPIEKTFGSVQWHLIFRQSAREEFEGRLTENFFRKRTDAPFLRDQEVLGAPRHFLGLWKSPEVTLGTNFYRYEDIASSTQDETSDIWKKDGKTISAAAALGHVPATASLGYAIGYKLASTRLSNAATPPLFQERLGKLIHKPIVLYCPSEQRAWMVSFLSVVLHLAHARAKFFAKEFKKRNISSDFNIPFCVAQSDGGGAAFQVLIRDKGKEALKGEKTTIEEYIIYLLSALDSASKEQFRNTLTDFEILGHEFKEVALCSDELIVLKQRRLSTFKSGWACLLDGSLPVLFYEGFSVDPIRPCMQIQGLTACKHWPSVPSGFNFLAASLPVVGYLAEKKGCKETMHQLNDKTWWHSPQPLFAECQYNGRARCPQSQKVTNATGARVKPKPDVEALRRHPTGAVLFEYESLAAKNIPAPSVAQDHSTTRKFTLKFEASEAAPPQPQFLTEERLAELRRQRRAFFEKPTLPQLTPADQGNPNLNPNHMQNDLAQGKFTQDTLTAGPASSQTVLAEQISIDDATERATGTDQKAPENGARGSTNSLRTSSTSRQSMACGQGSTTPANGSTAMDDSILDNDSVRAGEVRRGKQRAPDGREVSDREEGVKRVENPFVTEEEKTKQVEKEDKKGKKKGTEKKGKGKGQEKDGEKEEKTSLWRSLLKLKGK
jgi:hypothetical protein